MSLCSEKVKDAFYIGTAGGSAAAAAPQLTKQLLLNKSDLKPASNLLPLSCLYVVH